MPGRRAGRTVAVVRRSAVGNAFHEAVVDGLGGGEHAPSPGIALEIIRWSAGDAGERAAAQCPPVQRDA
jgi:hypothetical protein